MAKQVSLRPGSTVFLRHTHRSEKRHLCIVLTDPERDSGRQVLYVPVVTARTRFDRTCLLEVGDHGFIKHTSCVDYGRMDQRADAHLLKVGEVDEPLRPEVLERVLRGVAVSPLSPPWAQKFLLGE